MEHIMNFPIGSNIPKRLWNKIRISPAFLLKHILDLQLHNNIKIIFCGNSNNAEKVALSIMRKVYKENSNV